MMRTRNKFHITYAILVGAILAAAILASTDSSAVVIEGEITPGSYKAVQVNSAGSLVSSIASTTGTLTNKSGTITAGGTSQVLAAANATRKYIFIQNVSSENCWINFTTTAVVTQPSVLLVPTGSFVMEGTAVSTEAINVICATTGSAFTAKEM